MLRIGFEGPRWRDGHVVFEARRRLRARRVDEIQQVAQTTLAARQMGVPEIQCAFGGGGTVANSGRAETEAVLTVAFPDGRAIQILTRISASNPTLGGVAEACCREADAPNLRPLFDNRFSPAAQAKARAEFIAWANEQAPDLV